MCTLCTRRWELGAVLALASVLDVLRKSALLTLNCLVLAKTEFSFTAVQSWGMCTLWIEQLLEMTSIVQQ